MTATNRFGLPLIATGQAQKDVTHNAAIHAIDRLLHLCAQSRSLVTPPAAPAIDASWIVSEGAGGDWAGQDGALACWDGGAWVFSAPANGTLCWIADEHIVAAYGGGAWHADFLPVAGLRIGGNPMLDAPPASIAPPAGGTVIDAEARTVIASLIGYFQAQGLLTS